MTAPRMNLQAFVDEFLEAHRLMEDVRYCWILGAGASISSGISAGDVFARRWFEQVYRAEKLDDESLDDFANRLPTLAEQRNIDLSDFTIQMPGTYYSELYDYRFRDDPARGFAQLEDAMRGKDPGLGYAVLARFLSQTRHRVVITVNFDNLVADAVAIHTDVFPLVVGHESLTNYIKLKQARPLVLKVHRDLLLDPMSRSTDLERLQKQWPPLLKSIFNEYTPVVIGYDGNDRTLMRFLADHEPLDGRLYWCHMNNQLPRAEIHELIVKHRGRLVAIEGFDELLFRLGGPLGFTDPLTAMRSRYEKRAQTYTKRLGELDEKTRAQASAPTTAADAQPLREEVKKAVEEAAKEENWWSWALKAAEEKDLAKREEIYREGIKACPKNPNLPYELALFLATDKETYSKAEEFFVMAVALGPDNAFFFAGYALFLVKTQNYDEAEKLSQKAIELAPEDGLHLAASAYVISESKKSDRRAEQLFRQALDRSPNDDFVVYAWAQFLAVKGRLDEARREAAKAWDLMSDKPTASEGKAFTSFLRWLLARTLGKPGEPALGRLKTVFHEGFSRLPWSFDRLLTTMLPNVPEAEHQLATKLADALEAEEKVQDLETDSVWQAVSPIALDTPWRE